MAIATKINGDLQRVSVLDALGVTPSSPIYASPITATFSGYIASATTVQVYNINGTITAGDIIGGAYIPVGTTTSAPAGLPVTITLTLPVGESIPAAAIGLTLPMATAPATGFYTAGKAVHTGGPRLDYYTLTIEANKHSEVMDVIQKKALVHVYQIDSSTSLAVGYYPSAAWGDDSVAVLANLQAECPAGLGATWITACAGGITLNT